MPFKEEEARCPKDIIQLEKHYYIRASSALADQRTRVLKHGDLFAVLDRYGDVQPVGQGEQGLFFEGTRHLSHMELRLNGRRLLLLGSEIQRDNVAFTVDLTNPDFPEGSSLVLPRDNIHLFRLSFLWDGSFYQRLRLKNFHSERVEFVITLTYESDFADIFEVRGTKRERKGQILSPLIERSALTLRYLGLDGVERRSRITFSKEPESITKSDVSFHFQLEPKEVEECIIVLTCEVEDESKAPLPYMEAYNQALAHLRKVEAQDCQIISSNAQFNDWFYSSFVDFNMMITETKEGLYPYAGVPWFSTTFGRDGIISALQYLWIQPNVAKGVLLHLAATQAKKTDPESDAEPGKIVHEMRRGEMAALHEIPFGKYYGSIDSTLLFLYLAHEYYKRTSDEKTIEQLWPAIMLALNWVETYGDVDKDGFIKYTKKARRGLVHQGWKDSHNSVFHSDGSSVVPPIALCEVQGYAFAALLGVASLARVMQQDPLAARLEMKAFKLKRDFHKAFWIEELGTYAIALDGEGRPCKVVTSNAGQCLFTGIVERDVAPTLVKTLFQQDMFSGWGIRTLSSEDGNFNPMSYHNGSVWPHDNSLIALGLKRYGFHQEVLRLMKSFLQASLYTEQKRLPELFCGFPRRESEGPTPYPVACSPQAWASGAVFLFIQAAVGLEIDAPSSRVLFKMPALPDFLHFLEFRNLRIGDATCDFVVKKKNESVFVNLISKSGDLSFLVEQ